MGGLRAWWFQSLPRGNPHNNPAQPHNLFYRRGLLTLAQQFHWRRKGAQALCSLGYRESLPFPWQIMSVCLREPIVIRRWESKKRRQKVKGLWLSFKKKCRKGKLWVPLRTKPIWTVSNFLSSAAFSHPCDPNAVLAQAKPLCSNNIKWPEISFSSISPN